MNTVLATDIFDDDLKESRNLRWNQVFGRSNKQLITALDDSNDKGPEDINTLRVMIVLDHLIQASDVAHTMQHWHVYIKWVSIVVLTLEQALINVQPAVM